MNKAELIKFVFFVQLIFPAACSDVKFVKNETLQNSAKLSAEYLKRSVKENGMFTYCINMDTSYKINPEYNILRHAGTIYSMCMYYQLNPDIEMKYAIELAGRYLRDEAISQVPDEGDMMAVWSIPEVNHSGKPLQAKLGGTGLGLVALISIEKFHPGFTPLRVLQALGRFIVFMQKDDGSFNSLYIPSLSGRQDEWQSLYYPGEAILGLLMLYEMDPSGVWIQASDRSLEYLALSRKNLTIFPADHWALLATEKILSLGKDYEVPVSRELFIDHAIKISESILQDQIKNPYRPDIDGSFSEDGIITYTSTRLEGLLAVLNILNSDHELKKSIEKAVDSGISFLLQNQIKKGEFNGAFPGMTLKPASVKMDHRTTEVRIDYVQHALSAIIRYSHVTNVNILNTNTFKCH